MLEIKNLHASIDDTPILRGIDLTIDNGQVHSLMGPNGSGKSTLAKVLAGDEAYEVTEGSILLDGVDLLELDPHERSAAGLFMAFQYPVEIPGVTMKYFLRTAINSVRKYREQPELDAYEFLSLVKERAAMVELDTDLLDRPVNGGFSGGEKKRAEIFQMAMLEPTACILDETDSGLDIDALRIVADGVNKMRGDNRSFLVITHYQRLLSYIVPDVVHVLVDGRIVRTGGKDLALELEEHGYAPIESEHAVDA
ncbi:MAG: Fe-S cluster assembly ATPase SufC [Phycisphaerales bacterium]|nr:Fe-S cluster assembly ATPase SufC [Phycisphaerales bacterium]|tara:strand:+ start:11743 stop:12501 length:759 start_codon:yes stop_codon:yes gene_type:complete